MKNVALIGFGRIGKMHFDKLKKVKSISVKYIIDDFAERSEDMHGIEVLKANDLEKVLVKSDLDACIIVTPSNTHVDLIKKIAPYKKDIFCEKPISFNIEDLEEVKKCVEENGIKFQVGLNRRFDPDFMALKDEIAAKAIGDIQLIKITNRDPKRPDPEFVKGSGGLFFDFNTHDFDMVHFLTGENVTEVYAMGDALIDSRLKELGDIDTALISLKLSNGALVMIDTSRETNFGYDQRIEVFGSLGMLKIENIAETRTVTTSEDGSNTERPYWSFVERYNKAYIEELKHFANYISQDSSVSPVGIDDMIASVKVASAVTEAYDHNKCVVI